MKRRFAAAVLIILAVLAGGEFAARRMLPDVPGCIEAIRNPYRFRGWPEYTTRHAVAPGTGRIVLLTNSQAYAGELPEHKIYPDRLEVLLNAPPPEGYARWELLNWSADGMTVIELMILAATLRDCEMDMAVAVTGYADYVAEHDGQGFLYCRSDIPLLAARPAVFRHLPDAYRRRHLKVEDLLTVVLHDRFQILRFREYAWSWAEARLPGVHELFFAPHVQYLPWEQKARAWLPPLRRVQARPGDPTLSYNVASVAMLNAYMAMLARLPFPVLVVSEPATFNPADWRWEAHQAFQHDLEAATRRHGLTLWDMHDGLPPEHFITSSHFHPLNHAAFAEQMAGRIRAEWTRHCRPGTPESRLSKNGSATDKPADTDTQ
jgi:hypothetical protein